MRSQTLDEGGAGGVTGTRSKGFHPGLKISRRPGFIVTGQLCEPACVEFFFSSILPRNASCAGARAFGHVIATENVTPRDDVNEYGTAVIAAIKTEKRGQNLTPLFFPL